MEKNTHKSCCFSNPPLIFSLIRALEEGGEKEESRAVDRLGIELASRKKRSDIFMCEEGLWGRRPDGKARQKAQLFFAFKRERERDKTLSGNQFVEEEEEEKGKEERGEEEDEKSTRLLRRKRPKKERERVVCLTSLRLSMEQLFGAHTHTHAQFNGISNWSNCEKKEGPGTAGWAHAKRDGRKRTRRSNLWESSSILERNELGMDGFEGGNLEENRIFQLNLAKSIKNLAV